MEKHLSYTILPELKLVVCNYQGEISIKEVTQLTLTFIADPIFNPEYNVLLDFRNSAAIGFRVDIIDYVNFLRKTISFKKKVKLGVVYSTPNQEFLLKFYKTFGKLLNLDIENFRQLEQYHDWMQFSEMEQLQINEALQSIKKFWSLSWSEFFEYAQAK